MKNPPVGFRPGAVVPDSFTAFDPEMAVRAERAEWLVAKYGLPRLKIKLLEIAGTAELLAVYTLQAPGWFAVVEAVVGRGR